MIAVVSTREVPLAELTPHPDNSRQGDIGVIVQSLQAHGQYRALVVNQRNNQIVAGNHTYQALRHTGATSALVDFIDVDEDQARRIMLVDNRANDLASYDEPALMDVLRSLETLDGTGYDGDDLDKLVKDLEGNTAPQLGQVEYRIIIECADEQQQADLLARFQEDGLRAQAIAQ